LKKFIFGLQLPPGFQRAMAGITSKVLPFILKGDISAHMIGVRWYYCFRTPLHRFDPDSYRDSTTRGYL